MENLDQWRKAGKIAAQAREFGKSLIKPGAKLLDVSDAVDKKIKELGGEPAFPTQISCDTIAAHYCAEPNDETILKDQLVSIDVGAHIDGCIGDCAATIDLSGKHDDLVKASEEALANAIRIIRPGITLGEIGRAIQDTISSYGFSPIKNLSGHGLSIYNIHDKPTIPNFDTGDKTILEKGMIVAIEPFATDGEGAIYETERANIFSFMNKKPVRSIYARKVLKAIQKYGPLPFTTRWLIDGITEAQANFGLRELQKFDIIKAHPPLKEKGKGLVSQAENTILVDGTPEILTKA